MKLLNELTEKYHCKEIKFYNPLYGVESGLVTACLKDDDGYIVSIWNNAFFKFVFNTVQEVDDFFVLQQTVILNDFTNEIQSHLQAIVDNANARLN